LHFDFKLFGHPQGIGTLTAEPANVFCIREIKFIIQSIRLGVILRDLIGYEMDNYNLKNTLLFPGSQEGTSLEFPWIHRGKRTLYKFGINLLVENRG